MTAKLTAHCLAVLTVLSVSPLLAARYVTVDEFEDGVYTDKWWTGSLTNQTEANGIFSADSTSADPLMGTHAGVVNLDSSTYPIIDLSMSNQSGSTASAQVFWTGTTVGSWSEPNSTRLTTTADGKFHTYRLDLREHANWQGQITGLRIDPTSTSGVNFQVHHVRAVEATPYDSIDEFDDGSTSPWWFTRIGSVSESGGTLSGTATAYDPYMGRTTSIDAQSHLELKLRMKVESGTSQDGAVFWTGDSVGTWAGNNSQSFPIRADGQWHTYSIPLAAHPRWRGEIDGIRIDPFNTGTGKSFELDYFRASQLGNPDEIIIDDFNDNDRESFWGAYNIQNGTETTMDGVGYFYGETAASRPSDPVLQAYGNGNFEADDYYLARVTMAHDPDSETSTAQIFWVREGDAGYVGSQRVEIPIIADGLFHTYEVNMGAHSLWNGTITSLRLDPIDGTALTAGRWFKVDSFLMTIPEPSTLLLAMCTMLGLLVPRRRRS